MLFSEDSWPRRQKKPFCSLHDRLRSGLSGKRCIRCHSGCAPGKSPLDVTRTKYPEVIFCRSKTDMCRRRWSHTQVVNFCNSRHCEYFVANGWPRIRSVWNFLQNKLKSAASSKTACQNQGLNALQKFPASKNCTPKWAWIFVWASVTEFKIIVGQIIRSHDI